MAGQEQEGWEHDLYLQECCTYASSVIDDHYKPLLFTDIITNNFHVR